MSFSLVYVACCRSRPDILLLPTADFARHPDLHDERRGEQYGGTYTAGLRCLG